MEDPSGGVSRPPPRRVEERTADTLAKLTMPAVDTWVATAGDSSDGPRAHLVPLSLAWIDGRIVIAIEPDSVTARNIMSTGRARLGLGPTRDVVMIEAVLDGELAVDESVALANDYARQADWDPRDAAGYQFLRLRPVSIQAWREANEIAGRTIMRGGAWVSAEDPAASDGPEP